MKSEWKSDILGNIVDIKNGYAFKSKEFTSAGVPVLKIKNVKPNKILLDSTDYVAEETAASRSKWLIQKGDILLTMTGNRADGSPESWVGKAALFNEEGRFLLNQRVAAISSKVQNVDTEFLGYFLSSWNSQLYFIKRANSSGGQANISPEIVKNMPILIPPLGIQKKIVTLLNSIKNKISLNQKINDNLEQQAQAQFKNLLETYGSKLVKVSEIAYLNPKRTLKKGQNARYIDMSKLPTDSSFPSGWDYKEYSGGSRFTNGDTLLARITPCLENGKTAYIDFMDENEVAFGSTEYIVFAPKPGIPAEYLYCLARYPSFVDYAVKNMNGSSGRQRVSTETIGNYELYIPKQENLDRFGKFVHPLFDQIRYHSFQNMRLTELRDTLLPKLMSGEIDVSDVQI